MVCGVYVVGCRVYLRDSALIQPDRDARGMSAVCATVGALGGDGRLGDPEGEARSRGAHARSDGRVMRCEIGTRERDEA